MAGWIKQPKSEPASPVAVLDEAPILNEAESRSLFKQQIEARLAKAQQVLAKRQADAAKIEEGRLAEELEAFEAAAELARIEAQEAAEASRVEQERKQRVLQEWRAATLNRLLSAAVDRHEKTQGGSSLLEEARIVFEEMFRVSAPPAEMWKQDGPYFECPVFERAVVQMVVHPNAAEIGEAEWIVSLSGELPYGIGGFQIADRGVLGRYLVEYDGFADWLQAEGVEAGI